MAQINTHSTINTNEHTTFYDFIFKKKKQIDPDLLTCAKAGVRLGDAVQLRLTISTDVYQHLQVVLNNEPMH